MTNLLQPAQYYQNRVKELEALLPPLKRKRTLLGWARLLSILLALGFIWYTISSGQPILLLPALACLTAFFIILSADIRHEEILKNTETLIRITGEELDVLHHRFHHLPDGNRYKSKEHDYTGDLDIFGHASLFQYINRTTSEQGEELLANWLSGPSPEMEIRPRQEAVKELSGKTGWRQQLRASGINHKISFSTQQKIEQWISKKNKFLANPFWKYSRFFFPSLSLLNFVLYFTDAVSASLFYLLVFLFFILSMYTSRLIQPEWISLNKMTDEMDTLSASTGDVEKEPFQSAVLKELQSGLQNHRTGASAAVASFKRILDRLDYRLNPLVFIPLNTLLFWDLQQVFALEKWRETHRNDIGTWFRVLASFETLSSLATISFNQPAWSYPTLADGVAVFRAEELGHPLIPAAERISSTFRTAGPAQIGLITGSNMAGKSTFLRSVGVNMVLAMAGAPVCAKEMTLSPMKVISSMRVSDNLEENTSTFYAELKKLKYIIEAVNRKEKVFLLLDEILRGTNSADRHTGSSALIKQLIQHQASGLIATHDLELAKLAEAFPGNLHNYHFDVQVEGEELYFDYKLKEGICQSMNASLLMKKIGIEL